jgi:hypothetical protein
MPQEHAAAHGCCARCNFRDTLHLRTWRLASPKGKGPASVRMYHDYRTNQPTGFGVALDQQFHGQGVRVPERPALGLFGRETYAHNCPLSRAPWLLKHCA